MTGQTSHTRVGNARIQWGGGGVTFPGVDDVEAILDLNLLVKQMALAMGLAMVIGNGYAVYKARRGQKPKGEEGEFRPARAWWLIVVGVLIATWGGLSLLTG